MCIGSNWVNEAQDLMYVTKFCNLPNKQDPSTDCEGWPSWDSDTYDEPGTCQQHPTFSSGHKRQNSSVYLSKVSKQLIFLNTQHMPAHRNIGVFGFFSYQPHANLDAEFNNKYVNCFENWDWKISVIYI